MISTARSTYSVDPNRIYVTGLSAGGGGAWDALATYPSLFAAGIPICGTLGPTAFQPSLAHKPVLAAHARNDPTVPVSNTRNMINAILEADGLPTLGFPPNPSPTNAFYSLDDGRLQYLELNTGGHGIWSSLYNSPPLYDWLLAQSLPEPGLLAPLILISALSRRTRRHVQ
jgi:predicted peptidase